MPLTVMSILEPLLAAVISAAAEGWKVMVDTIRKVAQRRIILI